MVSSRLVLEMRLIYELEFEMLEDGFDKFKVNKIEGTTLRKLVCRELLYRRQTKKKLQNFEVSWGVF